jgi:antitoxin CptB
MNTVDEAFSLGKLQWRCRRGLLENDLLLQRFFAGPGRSMTRAQAAGLETLMELADNDLLDLFLARTEPAAELDQPEVHEVLRLIRGAPWP